MGREVITEDYSGQGIVYLAEVTNEVPGGFVDVGNCSALSTSFEVSVFEKKESRTGSRLKRLRITTEKSANVSLTLDSYHKENLQKALFGALLEVASGAVTDSPVTARLGKVVPLPDIKVSAVSVGGTDANSAITYEVDKNYTVNLETGSIYFMTEAEQTAAGATNSIADAAALVVDYTRAAQVNIEAFGEAEKEYALRFEGLNTAKLNEPVVGTVHRLRLSPLKILDFISDETGTLVLEGPALATTLGKFVTIRKL